MITKQIVASKILAYLKHNISLNELIDWAENSILEEEFEKDEELLLMDIVGNLGLADVKSFGLSWEDCETMMKKLGYLIKIEASLAS
jgi:hypothetical protein